MHIELRIEGITVVDDELELHSLIERLEEAEEQGLWSSPPLSFEQAQDLVSRLDTTTLELVRKIVVRGGSISWSLAMQTCGNFKGILGEFETKWLEPLSRMTGAVRQNPPEMLIHWMVPGPESKMSEDVDAMKFCIDGPALRSLRKVLIG